MSDDAAADDSGAVDEGAVDVDGDDAGDAVEPDCDDCEDTGTTLWDTEQEIDPDHPEWDPEEPDQRAPQVIAISAGSRCPCHDNHRRTSWGGLLLWWLAKPRGGGGGEEGGGLLRSLVSRAGALLGSLLPGRRDR